MGMMNFRDDKYNVVDFVRWAMPNVVEYEKDFTYVIQMENSKWAITCNELIGTENLHKSQIQWRSTAGKRPWLSGLVKDKMCALIHVNELIKLFNQGINIEGDKS
jgi:purine-binding chemotaxis protein CheW